MKPAHRLGRYQRDAATIVARANADPLTVCCSPHCIGWGNRTLTEHPNTHTGNPPAWDSGHINAGQANGPMQPEVNVCNRKAGGLLGNQRRAKLIPTRQR